MNFKTSGEAFQPKMAFSALKLLLMLALTHMALDVTEGQDLIHKMKISHHSFLPKLQLGIKKAETTSLPTDMTTIAAEATHVTTVDSAATEAPVTTIAAVNQTMTVENATLTTGGAASSTTPPAEQ